MRPLPKVLSVLYFTTLQILFSTLSVFSGARCFCCLTRPRTGFISKSKHLGLSRCRLGVYLLVLAVPFAALVWAMLIKSFMGGDVHKNNVTPGVYPKWSRINLPNLVHPALSRAWCSFR